MPQRKSMARSITAARGSNARTTMHRQQHIRSNDKTENVAAETEWHASQRQAAAAQRMTAECWRHGNTLSRQKARNAEAARNTKARCGAGADWRAELRKQGLRTALRRKNDEQGLRIGLRHRANKQGSGSDGATSRKHEGKQGSDIGSSNRTRTCDPMINSHLLYQLSYRGTTGNPSVSDIIMDAIRLTFQACCMCYWLLEQDSNL